MRIEALPSGFGSLLEVRSIGLGQRLRWKPRKGLCVCRTFWRMVSKGREMDSVRSWPIFLVLT